MFIGNAKQRMKSLSVGAWNSEVDPDRVIKEVIVNCEMFPGRDAVQPQPPSKKEAEGVRSSALGPTRCPTRLKNGGSGRAPQSPWAGGSTEWCGDSFSIPISFIWTSVRRRIASTGTLEI
ncbi:hypothetical protein WAI453_001460 [Rhynchosporium graminicola]